jgi:hypothetical protein
MKVRFNGNDYDVRFEKYGNGRTAIVLVGSDGEFAAVATVNIPEAQLRPDQVFIKDYSENQGMLAALEKAGIVQATGAYVDCGYASMPVCRLLVDPPGQQQAAETSTQARPTRHDVRKDRKGADTRNEDIEQARRLLFCLNQGLPIPDGNHSPPADDPIPPATDLVSLERVRGQIAGLKAGTFTSYARLPEPEGAVAYVPGWSGSWPGLTELGKLAVLDFWVDWSGVNLPDRQAELHKHLDLSKLPPEVRREMPDLPRKKGDKLSLDELKKQMADEEQNGRVKGKDRGKER